MKESEIIELFYPSGNGADSTKFVSKLDDCAHIPLAQFLSYKNSESFLFTTDTMYEGTHFRTEWSQPEDLAIKLFHSNLSDLCSSGGIPVFGLLNLGLPPGLDSDFMQRFAKTLKQEFAENQCALVGGDTFRSNQTVLTLTLAGPAEHPVDRAGGKPNDALYVTGNLGLSLAGFEILSGKKRIPEHEEELKEMALEKHLRPRARRAWAEAMSKIPSLHAAMDVSDGIIQDSLRLARASDIQLSISLEKIPILADLKKYMREEEAVTSGEEYELLFLAASGLHFPFPCSEIGAASKRPDSSDAPHVRYFREGKEITIQDEGFQHFQ